MNHSLQERLRTGPIVIDGSIEAVLRTRGHYERPIEHFNLRNPLLIEQIHCEFIDAGAEIIQSNTACANPITLGPFNLADKVYEINRKGVWVARTASLKRAFVAGTVGPIGKFLTPIGKLQPEDVRSAFLTQIKGLLDGGCDLLLLKSFIDVDELEIAMDAAREISREIDIIAQRTFPEDAAVLATDYPHQVARRLARPGVIAIGSNGTVGPQRMLGIIKSLYGATDAILSAQPDIGIPTLVDGHPVYNATIEYVASAARTLVDNGVTVIGVDGGALPEHVRAIVGAVAEAKVGVPEIKQRKKKDHAGGDDLRESAPTRFQSNLGRKLLVTVELDVPRGLDMSSVYEGAEFLMRHGIDAVNISDGARARLRMNSITISHLVQQKTGMECISHLACRDRNMVGLQSELLGAHAVGVRNILAVTGDPAQIGDYPYATSVYDLDSIGLIRALKRMNEGRDLMGNPVGERTNFMISCACNPVADDMDREVARLERKCAEGATVAFTQPVFEAGALNDFLARIEHIPIKIMLGIIPLRTPSQAEFLHHEVPGMKIPEWIQRRIRSAADPTAEGANIAVEFLQEIRETLTRRMAGIYVMPPGKRFDMVIEILERASISELTPAS